MRKHSVIVIFISVLFSIIYPDLSVAAPGGPLDIGVVLYLSNNDYSSVALDFRRGIELAASRSEIPVRLHVEDDQLQSRLTVSAVQKLVNVDRVDVVFLNEYVQANAAAPVALQAGIPVVAMWESSPEIEKIGTNIFGLGLWVINAGAVPAQFAYKRLGARRAGLIYDMAVWSESVAKYFKNEFISLGGSITFEETLPQGASDFRAAVLKAKTKDIDVLFAPINDHPAVFFKQLKQSGFSLPVLTSDELSREFIEAAGEAVEGVYCSNAEDRFGEDFEALGRQYRETFGDDAGNLYYVALAYDAGNVVIEAWKNRGSQSLAKYLYTHPHYSGVLGPIDINERGSAPRGEVMYVVRNGKLVHADQDPAF